MVQTVEGHPEVVQTAGGHPEVVEMAGGYPEVVDTAGSQAAVVGQRVDSAMVEAAMVEAAVVAVVTMGSVMAVEMVRAALRALVTGDMEKVTMELANVVALAAAMDQVAVATATVEVAMVEAAEGAVVMPTLAEPCLASRRSKSPAWHRVGLL